MGNEKRKVGLLITITGIFLLFSGIVLFIHPHYTAAAPDDTGCRVSVSPADRMFYLQNLNPGDTVSKELIITNEGDQNVSFSIIMDRVEGEPGPGELGDLYPHLLMIVSSDGETLYTGPMSGLDSNFADAPDLGSLVGDIPDGESVKLDFTVHLYGPNTGNEFQGSTLLTSIIIVISCDGNELIIDPEDPGINPDDVLPQTGGFNYILIALVGLVMTITGLLLIRKERKSA